MTTRSSALALFMAAGSLACASSARAQQTFYTWSGPASGVWSAGGNWMPIGVPDVPGDVAVILAGASPVLNFGITIDKFGMGPGSSLTIANGASLGVVGQTDNLGITGLLSNEGTIVLNSAGAATDLIINGGDGRVAVHGNIFGTTARIATSNTQANRIYGQVGSERLIFGEGTLFEGSAQIGLNRLSFENFGVLRAVGSQGVTIDPNGAGFDNRGTLAAISGAMTLTGGTFRNLGNGMMVSDTAPLVVAGARVEGGRFATSPGGVILPQSGAVLAGTSLSGNMQLTNGQNAVLETSFTFTGSGSTLLLNSAGGATDLVIPGNTLVDATALFCGITSSNTQANRVYSNAGGRLTLQRGSISGSMQLGVNQMSLTVGPTASVEASLSQGITLDPNGDGVTNLGLLLARDGSTLNLTSGVFNNAAGFIRADTGSLVRLSAGTFLGGTINGAGTVSLQDSSVLDSVTSNAFMVVSNGQTGFFSTTLANNSTLRLESAGGATDLRIVGNATLAGSGVLTASNTQANRFYGDGGRLTHAASHTIRGAMQLGVNLMSITNNGVIESDGSQGMTIDPNAGGFDNNGTLRARTGSNLSLVSGNFDNLQGVIHAQDGASVTVAGSGVLGGLVSSAGTGAIFLQNSELTSVTSAADIVISNGQTGFVSTSLVNGGTVAMNSVGSLTDLRLTADTVISGPGMILASNTQANRFYAAEGIRLTNAAGHTIRGSMQLGVNLMGITNNGLIEAQGGAGMTIDPDGTGFDNNATLRALTGAFIILTGGAYENAGGLIEAADGSTIVITGASVAGGTLASSGSGRFRHEGSAVLQGVTNQASVFVDNGNGALLRDTLVNNATYTINSVGSLTDLQIVTDTVISGSGVLVASNTQANRFYGTAGARLTNALGHTIRGSMQLGVNLIGITNNGLIETAGGSGMTIDPDASGLDNNATIRANPGGPLLLTGGTFDNTTGVIDVPGGSCTLNAATILGGTIQTSAGGSVTLVGAGVLDGVTSAADVFVPNGNSAFLASSLNNLGTLTINSVGSLTDLQIAGNVNLTGGGTLTGSNTQANRFYGGAGATLTNGANHTISGSMQLGLNLIGITNLGTIRSSAPGGMTIDASALGFQNLGALVVSAGNVVINPDPFVTSGSVVVDAGRRLDRVGGDFVQTAGTVLANGEIEVANNTYLLQGGTLGGTGVVDANVTNSGGVLSPGASAGTLTIDGVYTQQAGGTLHFEVGGLDNPSQNDTLNITAAGSANLGGTIRIDRLNGFVPPIGQGFTIVATAPNQRFGTFASIVSNDLWRVVYLHNAAVAVFDGLGSGPCIVDFNGDGNVDPDDLSDYIACYFSVPPCPQADFNSDTNIDPDDLSDYIAAYFGSPC